MPRATSTPLPITGLLAITLLATGCGSPETSVPSSDGSIEVTSDDIGPDAAIPTEFTCEGSEEQPHLAWSEPPEAAVELVVIMDDPDAPTGTFTHWTVWGLEPEAGELTDTLPEGAIEGNHDFARAGYLGPCPPQGDDPHEYRFRVVAVGEPVDLPEGARPDELAEAMEEHVVGTGVLTAPFGR